MSDSRSGDRELDAEFDDVVGTAEAPEERGLFRLLGDLAGAGADLAQNTAHLAACEARVIVRRLVARVGLFFGFLVLAVTGLVVLLVGVAVFLHEVAGLPAWLGFVIVGIVAMGAGALVALRMLKKLGDRDLAFPATFAELRKDMDALGARKREAA